MEVFFFGILNFGHWNLFVIWFLVLGIFIILIKIQIVTRLLAAA
ncbi:hypothetical protein D1BOALGB6SA_6181 [Olavius sp. associated proteobacterium Delta 1]|nr:hypothetical protein D1BOALGB6SA_6181 [Olavius sp. associated proteobacterium Delta 1]